MPFDPFSPWPATPPAPPPPAAPRVIPAATLPPSPPERPRPAERERLLVAPVPGQRWYYFWCKIVGPDATGSVWVDASLPVRNAAFQAALIRAARDRAERVALGDAFDDYDFPSVNPIAGAPSPPPVWWRRISARLALDLVWAGTLLWVFATKGARV